MAQHWTQKPENKERLRAMIAKSAAKRKQSAAARRKKRKPRSETHLGTSSFRKKMRAVALARWEKRKAAGLGRHGSLDAERDARHHAAVALITPNGHAIGQRPVVKSTRGNIAKESYRQLALTGARTLLALIEEERETLLVFLKDGEKD